MLDGGNSELGGALSKPLECLDTLGIDIAGPSGASAERFVSMEDSIDYLRSGTSLVPASKAVLVPLADSKFR